MMCFRICLIFVLVRTVFADAAFQIPTNASQELPLGVPRIVDTNGRVLFIDGMFTTPAYQQEALRLVIAEANKVAEEMKLPETLPITSSNLTSTYIGPFGYNYQLRSLGNITTSNYTYSIDRGNKFSDLTIARYDDRCREVSEKYKWPLTQLNTNAAYRLAVQWLKLARMDVNRLEQQCEAHIAVNPYWNGVELGQLPSRTFTPIYYIWWTPREDKGEISGASLELFLPTKTLLQLHVDNPEYILRPPLMITNFAALFPGKARVTTNYPTKSIIIDGSKIQ
jgi:hypothetical protein